MLTSMNRTQPISTNAATAANPEMAATSVSPFSLLDHRVHFTGQAATRYSKHIVKDFVNTEEDERGISRPVDRLDRQWEWLAGMSHQEGNWERWERHPNGDELVVCLSGSMHLAIEFPDGTQTAIELPVSHGFIVPAGTWHRGIVTSPGDVLTVTFGSPSEHRRVSGSLDRTD
jgi:mannose-6-phosphate isomerase-like protein (cupin superfamily)